MINNTIKLQIKNNIQNLTKTLAIFKMMIKKSRIIIKVKKLFKKIINSQLIYQNFK